MDALTTLSYVLEHAEELPWKHALFLPKDRNWTLQSASVVCDPDDLDAGEEVPAIASKNGLIYALNMSSVQDIVANAKQQKAHCTPEDLLRAFLFYHKNDAFILFE